MDKRKRKYEERNPFPSLFTPKLFRTLTYNSEDQLKLGLIRPVDRPAESLLETGTLPTIKLIIEPFSSLEAVHTFDSLVKKVPDLHMVNICQMA